MHSLIDLLRPRLPARGPGTGGGIDAWRLLVEAHDLDQLRAVAQALAHEHFACRAAQLLITADLDALALAAPSAIVHQGLDTNGDHVLAVPLVNGQACLSLRFEPILWRKDEWPPDAGDWIDLLDLRLAELLAARDLRRAVVAAQRNEHLQHALYAIADLAYSDLDLHEMLARVHAIVGELTYAENFYIALYDEAHDLMHFGYYADAGDAPMSRPGALLAGKDYPNSLTFAVLHGRRSLHGPSRDLRASLDLGDDTRLGAECVDWLGVPMLEGERVRGAIVVQSYDESRRYSEEDRALLAFVAQHILTAVIRKQAQHELEAEVQRRTAELAEANLVLREEVTEREHAERLQAALFRIAELAGERGSLDQFYTGVHQVVSELLDARNFYIAALSDDGETLHFPYWVDEYDTAIDSRRLGRGKTEYVLRQRHPLLAFPADVQRLVDRSEIELIGTFPACWLGVPLLLGERAVGVLVVQSYDTARGYTLRDQEVLVFASYHIATAIERKQSQESLQRAYNELEQRVDERTGELKQANEELRAQVAERERAESRLKYEALHDALTGLPNRTAVLDRLALALQHYRRDPTRLFAVLFLDLDRFKVVNDSVGHLAGDELLVKAGQRIAHCLREPDSVARLGGDEFLILIEDIHSEHDAAQVAERVLAALVDPFHVGDKEIYTSASIGIALVHPGYAGADELLRDADVAMYRAKARGRKRYELFDQQLREEALHMLDLESDLRRGLARREFEPFLQPIVRLQDGVVLGYEALLRWRHAERGLLLPSDFLVIAEDSGNIEQIDWMLYEQVFAAIANLSEAQAYVGINVSARHFRSPNLAANLLDMLAAYQVPPQRLRIEITEGALLENSEQSRITMLSLRDAGVLTSLDDFGTGYSSLSYLHRFPLHALKIDRSFIAELRSDLSGNSAAVVRAIQALAGSLEMEVIAEGIETSLQRDALLALECEVGQGFLFAEPRPAVDFARSH